MEAYLCLTRHYRKKIDEGLEDHPSWVGRHTTIDHLRPMITKTVAVHPELAPALRALKKDALDNLDTLLPQTIAAMEQNGFHVYVAEESSQAADYIANIVGGSSRCKIQNQYGERNRFNAPFAGTGCHRIRN